MEVPKQYIPLQKIMPVREVLQFFTVEGKKGLK